MALESMVVFGTGVAFYQAAEANKGTEGLAYAWGVCKDAARNLGIGAAAAAVAHFAIQNAPALFAMLPSIGELVATLPAGEAVLAFGATAWTAVSGFVAEAAAIVLGLTMPEILIIAAVAAVAIAIIGGSFFIYKNWDEIKGCCVREPELVEVELPAVDESEDLSKLVAKNPIESAADLNAPESLSPKTTPQKKQKSTSSAATTPKSTKKTAKDVTSVESTTTANATTTAPLSTGTDSKEAKKSKSLSSSAETL